MEKEISQAVIRRMPRYYRYLGELMELGVERISSNELSSRMKVTASQIRQDLNNFGGFGQQGYGYNVPELMALPLAKAMEVPLAPQALVRTRAKRHQAGLPLEQRMANVAGAFRAAQPQQLEGKRILLVDDVITTGTTAAACAQALLHAGADSVFALAFATVEFGAPPDDTTPICEDDEEDVYSDF